MAEPTDEPTGEVEVVDQIGALTRLWRRSPSTVIGAVLLGGTGIGTVGSLLIAPYVMPHVDAGIAAHSDDLSAHEGIGTAASEAALVAHDRDAQAHPAEFQRLHTLESRVDKLEDGMVQQGRDLATMNGNLSTALRLLERSN